jgi:hypothetical protein
MFVNKNVQYLKHIFDALNFDYKHIRTSWGWLLFTLSLEFVFHKWWQSGCTGPFFDVRVCQTHRPVTDQWKIWDRLVFSFIHYTLNDKTAVGALIADKQLFTADITLVSLCWTKISMFQTHNIISKIHEVESDRVVTWSTLSVTLRAKCDLNQSKSWPKTCLMLFCKVKL